MPSNENEFFPNDKLPTNLQMESLGVLSIENCTGLKSLKASHVLNLKVHGDIEELQASEIATELNVWSSSIKKLEVHSPKLSTLSVSASKHYLVTFNELADQLETLDLEGCASLKIDTLHSVIEYCCPNLKNIMLKGCVVDPYLMVIIKDKKLNVVSTPEIRDKRKH